MVAERAAAGRPLWLRQVAQAPGLIAGAFGVQAVMVGCLFSYGVFVPALEAEFGWSRAQLSAGSTLVLLLMGGLAFPSGALVDRFGPRGLLRLAAVCVAVAFVVLGSMQAPWQLLAGFALLQGLALSVHDVGTLSPVARRFPANRGVMTGIVKTGTALGQALGPAVVAALIAGWGWRQAAFVLAAAALLLLLLAAQGVGSSARGAAAQLGHKVAPSTGMSLREARCTRTLWTLCAVQFCFFPALMTVPVHLVSHGLELGLGAQQAAWTLSTIGACSALGRLSVGFAFDRWGGKTCLVVCLSVLLAALALLRFNEQGGLLYLFAACYGFAHGGLFTAVSPTVASIFGMRAHAALFGMVLMSGTASGAAAQFMAGVWHDAHGDYRLAFSTILAMAALGLALALSLPRPPAALRDD